MLNILEPNTEELTTLNHNGNVFHDALEKVKEGEVRFHVTDPTGKVPAYDLAYTQNMLMFPPQVLGLIKKMTAGGAVYADYLDYDEDDTENIVLNFLSQFDRIEIECVDEYSIGVAKVAIRHTDLGVYTPDERIYWFIEDQDRVHIEELTDERKKTTLRLVPGPLEMGYTKRDWSYLSSVAAFQNLYMWQAFTEGKNGPFKYVEIVMTHIAGIGAVLAMVSNVSRASAGRNLKAFLSPGCTRYPDELLSRYFHINPKPDDANAENTIVLSGLFAVFTTSWYCCQYPANFDESILSDNFAREMEEYANAVIGGKKILGVLARGTDYRTANLGADRTHARVDQMVPVIQEWMEEGGYEKIFVATEDQDNLDQMRAAFPGKVIAVAQERMKVSELQKKGTSLIYEYELKANQGQAYKDNLEDTTVNYFYALFILARCNAFLCSGQCNGWDTVRSLNKGKFERERKLAVALEGDPAVEKWKEIRTVTAGMFARGSYPVNDAFFMTFRFEMKETVSPEAVKKAWDKTLAVYPYLNYAVATRASRLVFLENPLPFVIEETGEVIEPFDRPGNFHTVTICYLGKTLSMYVDHVPFDGTGFKLVLETFFYHYFCELDGKEYDIPEGIFTEKDGPVSGLEEDAYLKVDAVDPKALMAAFGKKNSFAPMEGYSDEMFLKREDCRGYCISAPSDGFMSYAKSVGGSPMSVLGVFVAKAMERVHPENKLPVDITFPISVRKVMGNSNSLLHQVVHGSYSFNAEDFEKDDASLNGMLRSFLKGYSSDQNIKMLCGVYRGICEGYTKAFNAKALDAVVVQSRAGRKPSIMVSYVGTLRTAEYGDRIGMTAFHVMQEHGIMVQVTEVGGYFYIDWYQGLHGDMYAKAMRDLMKEAGITGVMLERVE